MEVVSGCDSGSRGIWMCVDHFWSRKELTLRNAAYRSVNRAALGLCVFESACVWTAVHRECVCVAVCLLLCVCSWSVLCVVVCLLNI